MRKSIPSTARTRRVESSPVWTRYSTVRPRMERTGSSVAMCEYPAARVVTVDNREEWRLVVDAAIGDERATRHESAATGDRPHPIRAARNSEERRHLAPGARN